MDRPKQTDTRTLYIGIDEAGYGPNLGPLVVSAVAFTGPSSLAQLDWWSHFASHIGRASSTHPLIVDDSKQVLGAAGGLGRLAEAVHSFLHQAGCPSLGLLDLHGFLDLLGTESLCLEHWFRSDDPCAEVYLTPATCTDRLVELNLAHGLTLEKICCRAVYPREFNQKLKRLGNKANVELETIRQLLGHLLGGTPSTIESIVVWVDRLGGRRYYRNLIEEIADGAFVSILDESPKRSSYHFVYTGRDVHVTFRVQGDSYYLPVALASMVAKYLRERTMARFNAYWGRILPGLVPTAGYPGDARRFLRDVRSQLKPAGVAMDSFWRKK